VAGCIGLHALTLAEQPLLARLETAGCKRLGALRCSSPALAHCLAQACAQLQVRAHAHLVPLHTQQSSMIKRTRSRPGVAAGEAI
jgi:hypothetical protein